MRLKVATSVNLATSTAAWLSQDLMQRFHPLQVWRGTSPNSTRMKAVCRSAEDSCDIPPPSILNTLGQEVGPQAAQLMRLRLI